MGEFRMPSLGADMEAGRLVEWKVAPGDRVHRGDIIAVVETAKGAIDVEVFEDGVVQRLAVEAGTEVPVGTVLATIGAEAPAGAAAPEAAPPPPPPAPERELAWRPATPAAPAPVAAGNGHPPPRVRATPSARHLAHELGVDLSALGAGGEVVHRDDVLRAAGPAAPVERPPAPVTAPQAVTPAPAPAVPSAAPAPAAPAAPSPAPADAQAAMRRAIAAAMARSKREIPHFYLAATADVSRTVAWLDAENARRGLDDRRLMVSLLLRAVARSLRESPALNGFYEGDAFRPAAAIHLGLAIALRGGGLVAPAIHDTDQLALDALDAAVKDLVTRARAGRLKSSELTDPTLTVTALGELGVESVYGIIYPPQVALVGFGAVTRAPVALKDGVVSHPVVRVTLSADHRVVDGFRGARFVQAVVRRLQDPEAP